MKITFKNGSVDLVQARDCLRSCSKFFKACMQADDLASVKCDGETVSFHEYGLSLDYVLGGESEESFLRYLISWGGPSEEIRFFYTPGNWTTPYRIEFVYMDWGTGVGFDVSGQDWAKWLADYWNDLDVPESKFTVAMENA